MSRFRLFEREFLKAGIFLSLVFLFGNLLVLDLLFVKVFRRSPAPISQVKTDLSAQNQNLCPASCIARIEDATSSAFPTKIEPDQLFEPPVSRSQIRESLITLGTGANASTDYENVPTTQVYIDPSKYGTIKSVKFEVSIAVPTANQYVYVRLYNVTDKNPVWNSEMYMSGGPSAFLESGPITLAAGNKLYVVQIKSQLKAITNLNQARLRIESY